MFQSQEDAIYRVDQTMSHESTYLPPPPPSPASPRLRDMDYPSEQFIASTNVHQYVKFKKKHWAVVFALWTIFVFKIQK